MVRESKALCRVTGQQTCPSSLKSRVKFSLGLWFNMLAVFIEVIDGDIYQIT